MLGGLSDIDTAGNQSMKNGIKYLAEFGNKIHVFTFFPWEFRTLQDPRKVFERNVKFHRLPKQLSPIFDLLKCLKGFVSHRKKGRWKNQKPMLSEEIEYKDEYSYLGKVIYSLFLYVVYLPFEIFRFTLFISYHKKPDVIYGLNEQGAVVASILGRLYRLPVITRFHGTNVTVKNLKTTLDRFLMFSEISALRAHCNATVMTNDGTQGHLIQKRLY